MVLGYASSPLSLLSHEEEEEELVMVETIGATKQRWVFCVVHVVEVVKVVGVRIAIRKS